MKEVTFKIDYINDSVDNYNVFNDFVYDFNDFSNYFLSLKGIQDIKCKEDNYLEITIQYTDDISLERIKLELELYFNIYSIPGMLAFDKKIKKDLKKVEIVRNMCCVNCLKEFIENLFDNNGVVSAYTNYDPPVEFFCDITFYITYDDTITSIEEIKKNLNIM